LPLLAMSSPPLSRRNRRHCPTTLRIYIHRDSNSRQQSSFCHDFTKYWPTFNTF